MFQRRLSQTILNGRLGVPCRLVLPSAPRCANGALRRGLNPVPCSFKLWWFLMLIKRFVLLAALCVSGLAVAQGLPRFGTAKFGEASFGSAEPALPVPFMPLWAIILLAVALWVVVYLMRNKES